MKFNVEKLKAEARPMNQEEKAAMVYRANNAEWLQLSATIALKIRKLMRQQGMTQIELASRLGVTPPQVSRLLSGKINFELKTLVGTPLSKIVLPPNDVLEAMKTPLRINDPN